MNNGVKISLIWAVVVLTIALVCIASFGGPQALAVVTGLAGGAFALLFCYGLYKFFMSVANL